MSYVTALATPRVGGSAELLYTHGNSIALLSLLQTL